MNSLTLEQFDFIAAGAVAAAYGDFCYAAAAPGA